MRQIDTEVEIEKPIDIVWQTLVDFDGYKNWNPFIPFAQGEAIPGRMIQIQIQPPGKGILDYRVKVLECIPMDRIVWLGHLYFPYLVDGKHVFELKAEGARRTKVVNKESFRGVLVPFLADFH